jgi:signal transduction histidine kinase
MSVLPHDGRAPGLGDLVDGAAVQGLLDDLYPLAGLPLALIDAHGEVLAGVGWQEICTGFHRIHPEACRHCVESDTELSRGVPPGELRRYRCRNNLWDVATPVLVDGRHLGNVFSGQFFYTDEPVDEDLFRRQAARYGFDEADYLAALRAVPRLDRTVVARGLAFLLKLAQLLSQLGASNLALRTSEHDLARAQAVARTGSWRLDVRHDELRWSAEAYRIFGVPAEVPLTYAAFLSRVHPDDRAAVDGAWRAALRGAPYDIEHRVVVGDAIRWVREQAELERDAEGALVGGFGTVTDVTERRLAVEALRTLNATLEERVAERTAVVQAQSERLRELALRLAQAERRERTRLSRLLHDHLQQLLVAAKLQAGVVARRGPDPVAQAAVGRLAALLDDAIAASRSLTAQLAPPVLQERGLLAALRWLADWMREHHGLAVALDAAPDAEPGDEATRTALFEAARELLLNVVKHAAGSPATLTVDRPEPGAVRLVVADRGRGAAPEGPPAAGSPGSGLGLLSVRERLELLGGSVTVESVPGGGTRVVLVAPAEAGAPSGRPSGARASLSPVVRDAG